MKYYTYLLLSAALITGCANPLNRVTSDRYTQMCLDAEHAGNMGVAAEACYRAYVNVKWGNLGPELKSERLYNFGRVLRKAGRYEDAKKALTSALEEEERLSGSTSVKTGRRMAELAATYYELGQIDNGVILVDRLIPITDQYTSSEKMFIAALLYSYGDKLRSKQQQEKAEAYLVKMKELGYSEEYFKKMR